MQITISLKPEELKILHSSVMQKSYGIKDYNELRRKIIEAHANYAKYLKAKQVVR